MLVVELGLVLVAPFDILLVGAADLLGRLEAVVRSVDIGCTANVLVMMTVVTEGFGGAIVTVGRTSTVVVGSTDCD